MISSTKTRASALSNRFGAISCAPYHGWCSGCAFLPHVFLARRNKEAALNAFIGKKAEIDEMLARLQALSDDHFNCHPDEVGWAMVSTLEHCNGLLKRITDSAFGEGEYAK